MDRVNEGKDGGASEWESASSLYKACQQTLGALCDHFVASVENRHRICQIHMLHLLKTGIESVKSIPVSPILVSSPSTKGS
jgi:hypothetical protein